jgi:short-subunit dehydrogenase
MDFRARYGPWAVVAGASEGLGAAFAEALGARGVNLLLLARRAELLSAVAERVRTSTGVQIRAEVCDTGRGDFAEALAALTRDVEVGCGVYNAAAAPIGPFLNRSLEDLLRVVDVNVRAPLIFARTLAPPMAARGRGGIVLMSSIAGFQGAPNIATYAASKAFNIVFAEGLWSELSPKGVDVLVSCAGAVRTPGYASAAANTKEAPGTLDALVVANRSLDTLGRGPSTIPGATNRFARFVLGRLMPRTTAIGVMAKSTKELA